MLQSWGETLDRTVVPVGVATGYTVMSALAGFPDDGSFVMRDVLG